MKIELNEETRFSIGDTIYYFKYTNRDGHFINNDKVVCIQIRVTEHWTNIAYMTQCGDSVYDFSAFASLEECKNHSSWKQKQ